MMPTNKYMTIEVAEYADLLRAAHYFWAFECGGVDSWMWHGHAIHNYIEGYNDANDCEVFSIEDIVERELENLCRT